LAGINAVFVDVGVDKPADLAITGLELEQQVVEPGDKVKLTVTVRATGTDADTFVLFSVDGETPGDQRPVKVPSASSRTVSFERSAQELGAGPHRIEVRLANADSLPANDARFATFEVRATGREVLALADEKRDARVWRLALDTHRVFRCTVKLTKGASDLDPEALLAKYKAVCLIDVADPSRALWDMLTRYVQKGGNLVVVPGGDELKREAYNGEPAQQLLPGQLKELVAAEKPGVAWEQAGPHL